MFICDDRHTDRQTNKQTDRQTNKQTNKQTDRQTIFFMDKRKKQIKSHSASGKNIPSRKCFKEH